jgi:hypothetical protein
VGAIAHVPSGNTNDPIATITFYTKAYNIGVIPGIEIRSPFRGTVSTGLSFEKGPVSRREVEANLGVIDNYATNLQTIAPFARVARPYWWKTPWGTEDLAYPNQGISFSIKSNEVISFEIYPAKQKDSGARP